MPQSNVPTDPVSVPVGVAPGKLIHPAPDEVTERFDPIGCLGERFRRHSTPVQPVEPGRYIEIQGRDGTLHIPLGAEPIHIGRGLAADLHFDESSVSRLHSILIPRASGVRILDDRSLNGTYVNGRRVEQADLCDGDVIVLGRVLLRYMEI
jgi:hypothetical protein